MYVWLLRVGQKLVVIVGEFVFVFVVWDHQSIEAAHLGWFNGGADVGEHRPTLFGFDGVGDDLGFAFRCFLSGGV